MKVPKIFENEFKNLKLKRIRLKSDPANFSMPYEGYFLRENEDGTIRMAVIGSEQPFMDVQPCDIDVVQSLSNLDKLKLIIADTIDDKGTVMQVRDLNCITDIEGVLLSNGYKFEDLYMIFKKYFLMSDDETPVTEGILSRLSNRWNQLKSGVEKAERFAKGNYGAFASSEDGPQQTQQTQQAPEKQPKTPDTSQMYTKTLMDLGQPMPIDKLNWEVRLSPDRKTITFTKKQELGYSSRETKMYSPEVLKLFKPGAYFSGSLVTKSAEGVPLKIHRNHFLVDPRTIKQAQPQQETQKPIKQAQPQQKTKKSTKPNIKEPDFGG